MSQPLSQTMGNMQIPHYRLLRAHYVYYRCDYWSFSNLGKNKYIDREINSKPVQQERGHTQTHSHTYTDAALHFETSHSRLLKAVWVMEQHALAIKLPIIKALLFQPPPVTL